MKLWKSEFVFDECEIDEYSGEKRCVLDERLNELEKQGAKIEAIVCVASSTDLYRIIYSIENDVE